MFDIEHLSDEELHRITLTKTELAATAYVEMLRRERKRLFIKGTLVAWIALLISIISLVYSIKSSKHMIYYNNGNPISSQSKKRP
jgi:hypothetical protein